MSGCQVIFHPATRGKVFVLPRNEGKIYVAGGGVEEAVRWIFTSGKVAHRQRFMVFESDEGRSRTSLRAGARGVDFARLRGGLLALGDDFAADEAAEVPQHGEAVVRPYLELFVRELSGSLKVTRDGADFVAEIVHAAQDLHPKLERVLSCLTEFGFARR